MYYITHVNGYQLNKPKDKHYTVSDWKWAKEKEVHQSPLMSLVLSSLLSSPIYYNSSLMSLLLLSLPMMNVWMWCTYVIVVVLLVLITLAKGWWQSSQPKNTNVINSKIENPAQKGLVLEKVGQICWYYVYKWRFKEYITVMYKVSYSS